MEDNGLPRAEATRAEPGLGPRALGIGGRQPNRGDLIGNGPERRERAKQMAARVGARAARRRRGREDRRTSDVREARAVRGIVRAEPGDDRRTAREAPEDLGVGLGHEEAVEPEAVEAHDLLCIR
jgi:hypothetical protein